jgi:hypothetical protein
METSLAEVDAKIERLAEKKNAWLKVGVAERIALLDKIADGIAKVADAWVEDGCKRKGIHPSDSLAGEEWLAGPVTTLRNVRMLKDALREGGQPKVTTKQRTGGQWVARVFPRSMMDRVMLGGVRADVWIEPGKMPTRGAIYRDAPQGDVGDRVGRVTLVLGAGNVSSIPPMDVLYKLFAENEVVLLKMNPVNEDVGPHLEAAFTPLVEAGYLEIVYGGADVGAHAAEHAKVDTLHVTGSDRTYDAIVWGATEDERTRRKESGERKNAKPFSAELGCVTPVLVVPGPWSRSDLEFQARHVAQMVTQNGSFNCNAAKVVVVARGWLQREAFLDALDAALAKARPRAAYYPGAEERYRAFLERYPKARALGEAMDGVPWTIIDDVPAKPGEYALTHEAFCGVLGVVSLDMSEAKNGRLADPPFVEAPHFLERAVPFANDVCWGNLSCAMLVHPETRRVHGDAVDGAIADLRYGGIGVNCWPGLVYGLVSPTWGAFPGNEPSNIGSGAGVVHNGLLFDHPQKSVVVAPFRPLVTPPYFSDHQTLRELGEKLFEWERDPTWGNLFAVAKTAIFG